MARARQISIALLGVTAFLTSAVLWADPPEDPILHEFFSREAGDLPQRSGQDADTPGEAQPIHTVDGPTNPANADPKGPGARNAPPPNEREAVLDRDTDREGWLSYFAVFDPTVAPFKRVGALDSVLVERGEVRLGVADEQLRRVRLSRGRPPEDWDLFRGTIAVALETEVVVPIPSVAPTMTVHEYRTEPPVELRFLRDGAGNFFVQSDHEGVIRLEYAVSAPRRYFSGPLPETGSVAAVPERLRPVVPDEVLGPASEAFEMLGLSADMPVAERVSRAAGYFRGFRAEPFPVEGRTENIYRDILFGERGVCRHRSFAFVVTVQAWGVPARYVYNEAHAFAEAWLPGLGWRRIDLGGGAEGLNVLNAADRVLHSPPGGDPLPTPSTFEESYSEQVRERDFEVESPDGSEDGTQWEAFGDSEQRLRDLPGPRDELAEPPSETRTRTMVVLDTSDLEAFRGEALAVSGRLSDRSGSPLPEQPLVVYLGPPSARPHGRVISVGTLHTDQHGMVSGEVWLPQSLPVGTWSVYLVFEGDERYAESRSP